MSRDGVLPEGVGHWMVDAAQTPAYESETCGTCGRVRRVPPLYLNETGREAGIGWCPCEEAYVEGVAPACEEWRRR